MILKAYTLIHVLISLVGIGSGFVVLYGLIKGKLFSGWTTWFLATTVATSVTGFLFPFHGFTPAYAVGAISLVVLAVAILARYSFHLAGASRWIFVVSSMLALYFNVFVLVVQLYQKVPALKALAPTQSEPPFLVTQLIVLALFFALTIVAARRFRIEPLRTAVHAL
jgi:hypothetical protein